MEDIIINLLVGNQFTHTLLKHKTLILNISKYFLINKLIQLTGFCSHTKAENSTYRRRKLRVQTLIGNVLAYLWTD